MDNQKTYTDEEITEDLKNPFDYGSPEYLAVVAKIKANREHYRRRGSGLLRRTKERDRRRRRHSEQSSDLHQ